MEEITTPDDRYLVISAPTYSDPGLPSIGKVWFIPTSKFETDNAQTHYPNLDSMATRIMKGSKRMGRFGWCIKSVMFQKDPLSNYADLMISAPTSGGDSLTYKGEVMVYYGTKNGLSLTPDTTLTIDPPPEQPLKHAHTNYGYSMTGTRYITVNSPFFSNQSGIAYNPQTFQTVGESSEDYSWYGYSRSVQYVNVPQTYLSWYVESVGAPNYRICKYKNCTYDDGDLQAGGQLSVFQDGKLVHQWTGAAHFEELGYSSSVGRFGRLIAVSSPGADVKAREAGIPMTLTQAGVVSIFYFHDKFLSKEPVLVFRMFGDRSYGRFGEIVRLVDIDGDWKDELIVSAPRRTSDVTEEFYGGEEGAVFIYKLPEIGDQPITFTTDQAFKSFIGTEHNARLGSSIHVMKSNKSIRLLTAATTSSKYGFKSGLLHNFLLHKY